MHPYRSVCLSFILLALLKSCACGSIRGLDPSRAHLYIRSKSEFACLDGTKVIPFVQVNDDYCDCYDGSDEPGTSACAASKFYCYNRGYEPKSILSSFVDDGICDCCDGSDELAGCTNDCVEKGLKALDSIRLELASKKSGLSTKHEYIKKAATLKEEWQKELDGLKPQIDTQQEVVSKVKAELDEVEERERQETEARRLQEEEEQKKREVEEAAKAAENSANLPEEQDATGQETAATDEQSAETADSVGDDVHTLAAGDDVVEGEDSTLDETGAVQDAGDQQATNNEEEVDAEELGRRIASQWVADSASTDTPEPEDDAHEHFEPEPENYQHYEHQEDFHEDDHIPPADQPPAESEVGTNGEDEAGADQQGLWGKVKSWVDKNVFHKTEPVPPPPPRTAFHVRQEYNTANSQLGELQRKQTELTNKLAADYGPDGAYAAIAYQCFENNFDKYTYAVCMLEKAAQKEGVHSTSLGNWGGFADNYTEAKFTGGQHCWQGPNRSLQVTLHCGEREEISKVEEPSRCVYIANFATPAACSAEEIAALEQELLRKEQAVLATRTDDDSSSKHDEL